MINKISFKLVFMLGISAHIFATEQVDVGGGQVQIMKTAQKKAKKEIAKELGINPFKIGGKLLDKAKKAMSDAMGEGMADELAEIEQEKQANKPQLTQKESNWWKEHGHIYSSWLEYNNINLIDFYNADGEQDPQLTSKIKEIYKFRKKVTPFAAFWRGLLGFFPYVAHCLCPEDSQASKYFGKCYGGAMLLGMNASDSAKTVQRTVNIAEIVTAGVAAFLSVWLTGAGLTASLGVGLLGVLTGIIGALIGWGAGKALGGFLPEWIAISIGIIIGLFVTFIVFRHLVLPRIKHYQDLQAERLKDAQKKAMDNRSLSEKLTGRQPIVEKEKMKWYVKYAPHAVLACMLLANLIGAIYMTKNIKI